MIEIVWIVGGLALILWLKDQMPHDDNDGSKCVCHEGRGYECKHCSNIRRELEG